jgi:U3 small nucleolar RNA-associated protein MPP10
MCDGWQGLGDVYEQDYIKEALGVQGIDKLSEEKKECAQLFLLLSQKLDALTNYHFTPKPIQDDMQVRFQPQAVHITWPH